MKESLSGHFVPRKTNQPYLTVKNIALPYLACPKTRHSSDFKRENFVFN